jgi:hypothetical protein
MKVLPQKLSTKYGNSCKGNFSGSQLHKMFERYDNHDNHDKSSSHHFHRNYNTNNLNDAMLSQKLSLNISFFHLSPQA